MIKINKVEQLNDVLFTKGKLVLIETGNINNSIFINNKYCKPIIISKTEEINVGDLYLKNQEIYNCIDIKNDARHGRIIIHSENIEKATISFHFPNTCRKILATSEQISPLVLQSIINGELKDGNDIYLECGYYIRRVLQNGLKIDSYQIKLNKQNQITLIETKIEETWDNITDKFIKIFELNDYESDIFRNLNKWLKENYKTPEKK